MKAMTSRRGALRPGFSLAELIIVVAVAMVLMTIAVPAFSRVRERKAVQNARDAYVWAAAVARALAVERGTTVALELDPGSGLALVRVVGADTIQRVDFDGGYGAEVETKVGTVTVCYTARGFAAPTGCSQNLPAEINFLRGPYQAGVLVQSLGQVERR
jgi:type II secretory pathway pseudopilin PulG